VCGICGIAAGDPNEVPANRARLRAMTDAIIHRGPDDDGYLIEPGVALGVRRLSIIDVVTGAQPMASEDQSVTTVFNGEIYNFRELRRELAARGHTFRSSGDTETIVHLYEEHGSAFPERLRGMFAIAVWDRLRRSLVLTRDQNGVKPLYVVTGSFGLAFASEVKSLIAGGLLRPALDPVAAELFMAWGYVPGPRTLFRGVRKLMPGTVLVWEGGALREERRYSEPRPQPSLGAGHSWADDGERLLDLLRSSVRARMISDVPVGVMLSGGIDSSLVATLMAQSSSAPIKTFSVAFAEDAKSNELAAARRVARRIGSDHHELIPSARNHVDLLDKALWHMEEPVADVSFLAFFELSRLVRESVTVALTGQGADELLGGYLKHQVASAANVVVRVPQLGRVLSLGARLLPPGSTLARGLSALGAADAAQRALAMSRVVAASQRLELLEREFVERSAENEIAGVVRQYVASGGSSPLAETLNLDARMALVDNMFLYYDKMSMANSLEVRVPFMDLDVVNFCRRLPDSRKVWLMRRKELLRRASRGLLEDAIIDKRKQGFVRSASGTWMRLYRDTLIRDTLLDHRAISRGQFRPEAVRRLVGRAGREGEKTDQQVLCLFLLERWQRLFTDGDGPFRPIPHAGISGREPLVAAARLGTS
jgi:asparagine synthase (glutamine-hydrolysing)